MGVLSQFSYLITLARHSRTALNRNGQSGHACLILDAEAINVSPSSSMLAVGCCTFP